jgi:DNA gyrase subunit A
MIQLNSNKIRRLKVMSQEEKIYESNVVSEYRNDMSRYAIGANRRRSVPEVKDGQKIVARRAEYAMLELGCMSNKEHTKCARIVGETMGKYHPHGDTSIYDTIVNLANWYSIKEPLVTSHGNFGNMQGDGPAAMRYTGAKLSKFAEDCLLSELLQTRDVVDWAETFDNKNVEPEYFPAALPVLLINGSYGIGVGLRSEIPKHNLAEVIDATINLMHNPDAKVVLVPDQCMKCHIVDTNWKAISNSGNGKYRCRADIVIEMDNDIPKLIIRSIPDMVTLISDKIDQGVVSGITKMIKEGKLPQIARMYDDSHGNDLGYVIELRKGCDPNYVRDYLYKHTQLEKSFTVNFEVMDGIEPLRLSYKAYLQYFIEFRRMTKFRVYTSLYQQRMTDWTEKQLYLRVMKSNEIDDIILKIRHLKKIDNAEFMEYLIKTLHVTDLEAKFIMHMDVMKLADAYADLYTEQCNKLKADAEIYLKKITNDDLIDKEIIEELQAFKVKYGKPRQCDIIKDRGESDIPKGEFKVVITENNYIKKLSPNDPINSYKGDNPKYAISAENTEYILLFDRNGKVFKYPVWKIPICDKNSIGIDIRILIKNLTSDIISMVYEPVITELSKKLKKHFLVVVTENNCIKKMDLEDFLTVTPSGITYTRLNENDFVKDIAMVPDILDVIIYSNHKALRVSMTEIPHYKRSALGVAAMNTKETIDGLSVIYPDATHVVVVTQSGRINKFDLAGFARSGRNKAGSSVIKLGKTDSIVSIYGVNDNNTLRIFTRAGSTDINIADIKVGSSVSAGEKMIALKGDNIIKTKILK